jgi:hypothetical protein
MSWRPTALNLWLIAVLSIWAIEVARSLPDSARIDSFDVSSEQFPTDGTYQSNLQFWTHDATKPFPENLRGQYDIVSIRFFLTLADSDRAKLLAKNITALLSMYRVRILRARCFNICD